MTQSSNLENCNLILFAFDIVFHYNIQTVDIQTFNQIRFYWKIRCAKLHFICVNTSAANVQTFMVTNLSKKSHHMLMGQRSSQALYCWNIRYLLYFPFILYIIIYVCIFVCLCTPHIRYSVAFLHRYINVYDLFSSTYLHITYTYVKSILLKFIVVHIRRAVDFNPLVCLV